jgi:hypothetical protein
VQATAERKWRNNVSHDFSQTVVLSVVVCQNLVCVYKYEVGAARGATSFEKMGAITGLGEESHTSNVVEGRGEWSDCDELRKGAAEQARGTS